LALAPSPRPPWLAKFNPPSLSRRLQGTKARTETHVADYASQQFARLLCYAHDQGGTAKNQPGEGRGLTTYPAAPPCPDAMRPKGKTVIAAMVIAFSVRSSSPGISKLERAR